MNMKNRDFKRTQEEKTLSNMNDFVQKLIDDNASLREKIREFKQEEEIKALQEEIDRLRSGSLAILTEKESQDAKAFSKEHYETCENFYMEYILVGTGIGTAISVKCKTCKKEKNITDMDNW